MMHSTKLPAGTWVLIASSLLSLVLGSVHAFSVFLAPLEEQFAISRSTASLTYSLALISLTCAVLFGHKIFSKTQPGLLVGAICLMAAAGALLAGFATTLPLIWIGYSLLFGGANGFGYAFGLQLSAQANPGREGMAMGIVTASYALGATISPALYSWAVSMGGFQWAMFGLAGTLLLIAPLCAAMLARSGASFQSTSSAGTDKPISHKQVAWLWLGYGAGVAAGLMAIGHATGIAGSAGLKDALWVAPVVIALLNLGGSIAGGWLVDRVRLIHLLAGLPLISATALLLLALTENIAMALTGLGIVGFTYGAIIAVYPAVVAKLFGILDSTRIYGRVFTAWGTAGLIAPWFAGYLFDQSGDYALALTTAAALGIISAAAIFFLHLPRDTHQEE